MKVLVLRDKDLLVGVPTIRNVEVLLLRDKDHRLGVPIMNGKCLMDCIYTALYNIA